MDEPHAIREKIQELTDALKAAGLWRQQQPPWVKRYTRQHLEWPADFFEWLQFVYLPNRLTGQRSHAAIGQQLALQAKKFAADRMTDERIVRLLVELDALMP